MAQKKKQRIRAGSGSASKKPRPHSSKASTSTQIPEQTHQPYEQDTKRRIGQFSGAGEPPLMKK